MQGRSDNGEFPSFRANPGATRPSYDDEADAFAIPARSKSLTTASPRPRFPGTGARRRIASSSTGAGAAAGADAAAASSSDDDHFTLRDFSCGAGFPCLSMLLIRIFAVGFYEIPSRSMMDTMVPGDRVVTSKLTPRSSICSAATSWYSKIPTTG